MTNFVAKFADINVDISAFFESTNVFCADYIVDEAPDFSVAVSLEDIEYERVLSRETSMRELGHIVEYSDEYLETLALYRKIAIKMVDYGVLLFHGSGIAMDNEAYLFVASSSTGKSTHTRLWREAFGSKVQVVNDDKPLVKVTTEGIFMYGTPWDGKHQLSSNIKVPLKAVCSLAQDKDNHIEEVGRKEALSSVMKQIYMPSGRDEVSKWLPLVDELCSKVKFYQLGCNMDIDAARVAYEGMK